MPNRLARRIFRKLLSLFQGTNCSKEVWKRRNLYSKKFAIVTRLTPCLANYFPENVPVLTISFYSKSVHVLIKEKLKYFFFFCVVGGTRFGKCPQFEICDRQSWVLHRKFCRARHVIYTEGVKRYSRLFSMEAPSYAWIKNWLSNLKSLQDWKYFRHHEENFCLI